MSIKSNAVRKLVTTLKDRRLNLDISQRQLDDLVGVSDCMIAKWENGQRSPTAENLERWAKALGLHVALLPSGKKERKP